MKFRFLLNRNHLIIKIGLLLITLFIFSCKGVDVYKISNVYESGHSGNQEQLRQFDSGKNAYLLDASQNVLGPKLSIKGTYKGVKRYSITPAGEDDWLDVCNREIAELPSGIYDIKLRGSLVKVANGRVGVAKKPGSYTMYLETIPKPTVTIELEPNKIYYVGLETNSGKTTEWVVLYEVNKKRFRLSKNSKGFEDLYKTDPKLGVPNKDVLSIVKSYPPHCIDCKHRSKLD